MFEFDAYVSALLVLLATATLTWLISIAKHDVSIVDTLWGLMFVLAAFTYAAQTSQLGPRALPVIAIVVLWAVRLSGYIAWRNYGEPEDRRYRAIRLRNEPNFAYKSVYLVFWLQALLAWIVSLPLLAAITGTRPLNVLDYLGIALALAGLAFETIADWHLAAFKRDPVNAAAVMDRGLWRYSRHPNYFGEFCVWWGLYLIAFSAGGWWAVLSPLLMSLLLLRLSGVVLLEKSIGERRPAYQAYRARTNAFFPGLPRRAAGH